jgi:diacylglycerol O-acyltransferase / wax synthase
VVDGVGLNITVMSYLDHLDFGIVADRDQIADVWPLLEAAQHAVDELAAAIGGQVAPVPSRA